MVKEIVTDPIILKRKSVPAVREDISEVNDLLDTLNAHADHCAGMAANMIGISKTFIAVFIGKKAYAMINPKIVDKSAKTYTAEEGCLSHTGSRTAVRHSVITVEYLDKSFKKQKKTFKGFEAQVIQHEMDHFEGILI